jgi:hypothetical protein
MRIPRRAVYNDLPAFSINLDEQPAAATIRQADTLFEKVRQATLFKQSKIQSKRQHLRHVLHALKRAMHSQGCVLHPRGKSHPDFSKARLQVIEAMIELELLYEHRSPPGSPKMSRLLPMPELLRYLERDPWEFDPERGRQFVFLSTRRDAEGQRRELVVDWSLAIARDTQERLELINDVNSRFRITYSPYCEWEGDFVGRERQLRPVHVARFTERWDWHGRLYTNRYGHQGLRKIERRMIDFDECPSIELDYGGMHPRILYHLQDLEYAEDPYALWGTDTTAPHRLVAKRLLNAAINAAGRREAISAFNNHMQPWSRVSGPRRRKQGKAVTESAQLRRAYRATGETTTDIYERMAQHHGPIVAYFGSGAGMWLMRLDSIIALDVMHHFATQGIPCLSCHDSFIVPKCHAVELREAMLRFYRGRLGHLPTVKP